MNPSAHHTLVNGLDPLQLELLIGLTGRASDTGEWDNLTALAEFDRLAESVPLELNVARQTFRRRSVPTSPAPMLAQARSLQPSAVWNR